MGFVLDWQNQIFSILSILSGYLFKRIELFLDSNFDCFWFQTLDKALSVPDAL